MDPLEYITLFRNLLQLTESIAVSPIELEAREKLLPIFNLIVSDVINLLTTCKQVGYSIQDYERLKFRQKIFSNQKNLDELVEELHLIKECSKCKSKYPATSRFFYSDKKSRNGLRNECKDCYSKAKKEYYKSKVKA